MKINRKSMVLMIGIFVCVFSFYWRFQTLIAAFEVEAETKEEQIQQYDTLSKIYIELIGTYGELYYKEDMTQPLNLMKFVIDDTTKGRFSLDGVQGTIYEAEVGNTTGNSTVLKNNIGLQDLGLALQYNVFFKSFSTQMAEAAWLYYTAESGLINLFPFVTSKDFSYDDSAKTVAFYQVATPLNNPDRQSVWTPVYEDTAGKGLMVTLSRPIYHGEEFRGVISIDFTNSQLSKLIHSSYEGYLVDHTGSLIASSTGGLNQSGIVPINDIVKPKGLSMRVLESLDKQKIVLQGQYLVYVAKFDKASWQMFYVLPVINIALTSLIYVLPVLLICILSYLAVREVENRRQTENQLEQMVSELKSSQELLKNAAYHDFLTDSYNRRGFVTHFEKLIKTKSQEQDPVVMVLGDVDHFKIFNENYGQKSGDRMLVELTKLMKSKLNEEEILCRWSGESFILLLYGKSLEEAESSIKVLKNEIESLSLDYREHQKLQVTMTFGISVHIEGDTLDNTLMKAELALREGKLNGRNKVIVFGGYRR